MAIDIIKVPDIGEGVVEVEVVEWNVSVGDRVREDDLLASVMTDKAAVEIPCSSNGVIVWLAGKVGDVLAVGSDFVKIDAAASVSEGDSAKMSAATKQTEQSNSTPNTQANPSVDQIPAVAADRLASTPQKTVDSESKGADSTVSAPRRSSENRPIASPAVRKLARDEGIDLKHVTGTGPAGRISRVDLDNFKKQLQQSGNSQPGRALDDSIERVELLGLRRRIAERMQQSKQRIPHFSYVEEIDVTTLMDLRAELNDNRTDSQVKLSILPFILSALVKAVPDYPQINARFNDELGYVERYGGVHVGIAAQTDTGLVVPVVAHAESRDIWDNAAEIIRVAQAARNGSLKREEMTGSTITLSSLGALGGIVSTPVINYPEVAIVGVNKIATRPVWVDDGFVPRQIMNLSSSFDHRVVDGWDAASFIQRVKSLLEFPATMFMER